MLRAPRLLRGGCGLGAPSRRQLVARPTARGAGARQRWLSTEPAASAPKAKAAASASKLKIKSKAPVSTSGTEESPDRIQKISRILLKHLWPQGDGSTKRCVPSPRAAPAPRARSKYLLTPLAPLPSLFRRVVLALSLLVSAKLLNVQVPMIFKEAIDALNVADVAGGAAVVVPVALLASYGAARAGAKACDELRNAVFATVSSRVIRSVNCMTFRHLLDLDHRFHVARQTGALVRPVAASFACPDSAIAACCSPCCSPCSPLLLIAGAGPGPRRQRRAVHPAVLRLQRGAHAAGDWPGRRHPSAVRAPLLLLVLLVLLVLWSCRHRLLQLLLLLLRLRLTPPGQVRARILCHRCGHGGRLLGLHHRHHYLAH